VKALMNLRVPEKAGNFLTQVSASRFRGIRSLVGGMVMKEGHIVSRSSISSIRIIFLLDYHCSTR
jgi:hypothetical protein